MSVTRPIGKLSKHERSLSKSPPGEDLAQLCDALATQVVLVQAQGVQPDRAKSQNFERVCPYLAFITTPSIFGSQKQCVFGMETQASIIHQRSSKHLGTVMTGVTHCYTHI